MSETEDYDKSSIPIAHKANHQDGGGDEISVTGLSGLLADPQTPTAHKASHEAGGSDILTAILRAVVTDFFSAPFWASIPDKPSTFTPAAHKTSHQSGGSDQINLLGMTGLLGTAQTPIQHKIQHQYAGADEISVAGLSGLLNTPQTPNNYGEGHIFLLGHNYYSIERGTWVHLLNASQFLGGYFANSPSAQNDEIHFRAFLNAGTYIITLFYAQNIDSAVCTVKVSGTPVYMVDFYGPLLFNQIARSTPISLTTSALHTIAIVAATRNGSSTGWSLRIGTISFIRVT
jgi:hypothetical protein